MSRRRFYQQVLFFAITLLCVLGLSHAKLVAQTTEVELKQAPGLSQMIAAMESKWQRTYETYFQRSFVSASYTGDQIAARLQDIEDSTGKRIAVIWLSLDEEELTALVTFPGQTPLGYHVPEAKQAQFLPIKQDFLAEISQPTATRRYLSLGKQLYDWMLAPVETALTKNNINTIVFCVGPGLKSIPFSALYDGEQFLVEKYGVSLIPGFNLSQISIGTLADAQILAMGASQFADETALPGVETELETIAQTPWPGEFVLNKAFSLEAFQRLREKTNFSIVHLATHANFVGGAPAESYIQFGDRRLTLSEMTKLNLNDPPVDLLVLSACQTAVGDKNAELGFSGLAIQAGVRTALASFWYVSDAGTLALMSEFYQRLKQSFDKADALRQTQIGMIRGTVYVKSGELVSSRGPVTLPPVLQGSSPNPTSLSHPFYWAGFSLIGSPL